MQHYDFFAIGAGSGGVRAARIAAAKGLRVGIAEEGPLGGTCVNVGCVPKKLLAYASHFRDDFEDCTGFGWRTQPPSFDWKTLLENKNHEIERLNGVYDKLLRDAGVDILHGRARLLDKETIAIGDRRARASTILIATGGQPNLPDIPGAEHAINSNQAFYLEALPRRVAVIGGGYIAVEFAGIFHGLGAEVHLIHRGETFLRGFDEDLRRALAAEYDKRGIDLRFDTLVSRIDLEGGVRRLTLTDGSSLEADMVLCALGRHPNTRDLGLEEAGVHAAHSGAITVDAYSRTNVANIYALGDCTDRMNLTPVAIAEAMAMVETAFGAGPVAMDYTDVPTAIFSQPPIGTVGLTEDEARRRFDEVDVYRSDFRALKHTLSGRDETTLVKLVVERHSDRVVGAHMLGPDAGEIIQGMAVALKCGATKRQFDATIGIHPTTAEEFVTLRQAG